jgi:D-alanine-D-alanine ligase
MIMHKIKEIGKIGVLLGGPSSEREISIQSGNAVYEALLSLGLHVIKIDVNTADALIEELKYSNIDIAFIALHGRFGEDGGVQSLLYKQGIPYTGSGPEASRLALDKSAAKEIFKRQGIPTPNYIVIEKTWSKNNLDNIRLPAVVKPCNEGSSIGMSIADTRNDIASAIEKALSYDDKVIIEDYIEGVDIAVGILNENPLPIIEIRPKERFYDYSSKYQNGGSSYIVPADLPLDITYKAQQLGLLAHNALGCKTFSRTDMIVNKNNNSIMVLEVNTIPGFTQTSLLPKAAKAAGMDFAEMCLSIIQPIVRDSVKGIKDTNTSTSKI